MIKSMTGFGQADMDQDGYEVQVELKSINHRFLDISMRLPRNLSFLEDSLRKQLQASLARGHVDVFLRCDSVGADRITIDVDHELLVAYTAAFLEIRDRTDLYDDITLSHMVALPDIVKVSTREDNQQLIAQVVTQAVSDALMQLTNSRETEGKALLEDMLARIAFLESSLGHVSLLAPTVVETYREKLRIRLADLAQSQLDPARFEAEVAIFADRCCIDEETVRLAAHLCQFRDTLDSAEPIGRKLEFILQEMNREVNTIGSKATDLDITREVVEMKSQLEKLREQVQNIE